MLIPMLIIVCLSDCEELLLLHAVQAALRRLAFGALRPENESGFARQWADMHLQPVI